MKTLHPFVLAIFAASLEAQAYWADGDGHYALRGVTETAPQFSKKIGSFQAIEQSFRLSAEARANDNTSMNLELRIFDDARKAYLGDDGQNNGDIPCGRNESRAADDAPVPADLPSRPCKHQDSGEPGYKPYSPKITKAYVRYAFDYCLVEAGRRGRDWGMGVFLDSGKDPFDASQSIFDGVTCNVNIQKSQTLGFSLGFDKLAETGTYVEIPERNGTDRKFGPNDGADDLDQFFFTIEFDDRKANAGAAFTKHVGVYFAQITGKANKDGGSNTDLKYLDLYTGFFLSDLAFRNEILFRMGKSADPNWQAFGGAEIKDGVAATNKLQSIGFAGSLEWTMSRSGAVIGPSDYNAGDASRHLMFFNYAYAPGDADGYLGGYNSSSGDVDTDAKVSLDARQTAVTAMAFNSNYKPALLLFNGRPAADGLKVDGVYDPSRFMNATLLAAGYRYESQKNGSFEAKLLTAHLNQTAPSSVKSYYEKLKAQDAGKAADDPNLVDNGLRPVGFSGNSLGVELDLSYGYKLGKDAEIGGAAGVAIPGPAYKIDLNSKPTNNFVVQSYAAFKF